jgi:hypothetical protein
MSFTLTYQAKLCLFRVLLHTCPFFFSNIQPYPPLAITVLFYLELSWGSAPLPSSLVELSTWQPLLQGFSAPRSLGGDHHSCLLWLPYLFTVWVRECPSPFLWSSGHPTLFVTCLFFFSCLFIIMFVFFFFPWVGSFCPGGDSDLFQGVLCAAYLLTWWFVSPKQARSWNLEVWEPSWFLCLTWCGDSMHRLGVWRCWCFASSWWFFLPGASPVSLQEFTLGSTLSVSSL